MQVFKFGGASVKDAASIKNVANILGMFRNTDLALVISAMGKTTNALEQVVNAYVRKEKKYTELLQEVKQAHLNILHDLHIQESNQVYDNIDDHFRDTLLFLENNRSDHYPFIYDQVVSLGELISTRVAQAYFYKTGIACVWTDSRKLICTNNNYTEAKVDFEKSELLIRSAYKSVPRGSVMILQGFIGSSPEGLCTTLGREGSDYTASVLAYCLDAENMIIWKDVPAVLNADPRIFKDTVKIEKLSYREAIEMTYYGAQVIHPKTIKPIQNKKIPLRVRSFLDLEEPGTLIMEEDESRPITYPPIIVYKTDQVLFSISVKDFSFVTEDNLSSIFQRFSEQGLRMNIMHNGAISFSAVVDFKEERIKALHSSLEKDFSVKYNGNLELLTIRHYTNEKITELTLNREILLMQKSRNTVQILMRKK